MRIKLSKHGNSIGLVIPAGVVRSAGLAVGQEFELETSGGELRLRPAVPPAPLSVAELLAGVPDGPLRYEDVVVPRPLGRERDW